MSFVHPSSRELDDLFELFQSGLSSGQRLALSNIHPHQLWPFSPSNQGLKKHYRKAKLLWTCANCKADFEFKADLSGPKRHCCFLCELDFCQACVDSGVPSGVRLLPSPELIAHAIAFRGRVGADEMLAKIVEADQLTPVMEQRPRPDLTFRSEMKSEKATSSSYPSSARSPASSSTASYPYPDRQGPSPYDTESSIVIGTVDASRYSEAASSSSSSSSSSSTKETQSRANSWAIEGTVFRWLEATYNSGNFQTSFDALALLFERHQLSTSERLFYSPAVDVLNTFDSWERSAEILSQERTQLQRAWWIRAHYGSVWNLQFTTAILSGRRQPLEDFYADFLQEVTEVAPQVLQQLRRALLEQTSDISSGQNGLKIIRNGIIYKAMLGQSDLDEQYQRGRVEFQGLELVWQHSQRFKMDAIRVPPAALVSVAGYRLLCIAVVPISKRTLVWGSCSGGAEIAVPDGAQQDVRTAVQDFAQSLGLAPHFGIDSQSQKRELALALDVEVHQTASTRDIFIVDAQRLLPPDPTDRSQWLQQLIRPELLQRAASTGIALSPDSCSNFCDCDPKRSSSCQHCCQLREVFPRLLDEGMAKCIATGLQNIAHSPGSCVALLHENGINLRYLGLCLDNSLKIDESWCAFQEDLLTEVVARSLKSLMWTTIRKDCMEESTVRHAGLVAKNFLEGFFPPSDETKQRDWEAEITRKYIGQVVHKKGSISAKIGELFQSEEQLAIVRAKFAEMVGWDEGQCRLTPKIRCFSSVAINPLEYVNLCSEQTILNYKSVVAPLFFQGDASIGRICDPAVVEEMFEQLLTLYSSTPASGSEAVECRLTNLQELYALLVKKSGRFPVIMTNYVHYLLHCTQSSKAATIAVGVCLELIDFYSGYYTQQYYEVYWRCQLAEATKRCGRDPQVLFSAAIDAAEAIAQTEFGCNTPMQQFKRQVLEAPLKHFAQLGQSTPTKIQNAIDLLNRIDTLAKNWGMVCIQVQVKPHRALLFTAQGSVDLARRELTEALLFHEQYPRMFPHALMHSLTELNINYFNEDQHELSVQTGLQAIEVYDSLPSACFNCFNEALEHPTLEHACALCQCSPEHMQELASSLSGPGVTCSVCETTICGTCWTNARIRDRKKLFNLLPSVVGALMGIFDLPTAGVLIRRLFELGSELGEHAKLAFWRKQFEQLLRTIDMQTFKELTDEALVSPETVTPRLQKLLIEMQCYATAEELWMISFAICLTLRNQGKFEELMSHWEQMKLLLERIPMTTNPFALAQSIFLTFCSIDRFTDARLCLERMYAFCQLSSGSSQTLCRLKTYIGRTFQREGQFTAAENAYREILQVPREMRDDMHLNSAPFLAEVLCAVGRASEAQDLLQATLAEIQERFGEDHEHFTVAETNFALVCSLGDPQNIQLQPLEIGGFQCHF